MNMKKSIGTLVAVLIIVFMARLDYVFAATPSINVYVNKKLIHFQVEPLITNGTTLVQYTTVFQALGLSYSWDHSTKTVKGYNDHLELSLTIGNNNAIVNGKAIRLSAAPHVIDGRTVVPLRFVGESTGASVEWNKTNQTIHIEAPAPMNAKAQQLNRSFAWGTIYSAVKAREAAELEYASSDLLLYSGVQFAGYPAHLLYSFQYNRLYGTEFMLDSGSNYDFIGTIGALYTELKSQLGEPKEDQIVFTEEALIHSDVSNYETSIAEGNANLLTTWQNENTDISIYARSDGQGKVIISVILRENKNNRV